MQTSRLEVSGLRLLTFSILSIAVLLAVTSPAVATYDYLDHDITAEISKNGSCFLFIECTVINTGTEVINSVKHLIGTSFEDLTVQDEEGSLNFTLVWEGSTAVLTINTRQTISPGSSYGYFIQFSTEDLVHSSAELSIFSLTLNITNPMKSFSFTVTLPTDAQLAENSGAGLTTPPAISPTPTSTREIDDKITIIWQQTNVTCSETQHFVETYEIRYTIPTQGFNYSLLATILASFGIGVITSFLITKFFIMPRWRIKESSRVISIILTPDENKIIDAIKSEQNETTQDKLIKKTGFSKSKISAHIKKLEEQGIIEKKRHGRKNIIKIKEKIEPKTENKETKKTEQ